MSTLNKDYFLGGGDGFTGSRHRSQLGDPGFVSRCLRLGFFSYYKVLTAYCLMMERVGCYKRTPGAFSKN